MKTTETDTIISELIRLSRNQSKLIKSLLEISNLPKSIKDPHELVSDILEGILTTLIYLIDKQKEENNV